MCILSSVLSNALKNVKRTIHFKHDHSWDSLVGKDNILYAHLDHEKLTLLDYQVQQPCIWSHKFTQAGLSPLLFIFDRTTQFAVNNWFRYGLYMPYCHNILHYIYLFLFCLLSCDEISLFNNYSIKIKYTLIWGSEFSIIEYFMISIRQISSRNLSK